MPFFRFCRALVGVYYTFASVVCCAVSWWSTFRTYFCCSDFVLFYLRKIKKNKQQINNKMLSQVPWTATLSLYQMSLFIPDRSFFL